ncbi:BTB/POZ domain-containing protein 6-like isoform X2 [Gigantopelta aegis]|nr:BTB/POZ domain-containing protein 6-like isoform X2 [Gigantopelta aegis]
MAARDSASKTGFVNNWQSGKSGVECLRYSLQQKTHCDVTFSVGEDRKSIPAHRLILSLRSCVFEAMLTGPLAEQENIVIPDIESDIFDQFLMFLYTDDVTVDSNTATGLLYLSKKYDVPDLEEICLLYLESSISSETACVLMEQAHLHDQLDLKLKAKKYICENGDSVLKSPGFTDLCHSCVLEITETDELIASEEKVFEALNAWSEAECRRQGMEITPGNKRSALGKALMNVRYSLLGQKYFVQRVSPNKLLTETEEITILKNFISPDKSALPFRKEAVVSTGDVTAEKVIEKVIAVDCFQSIGRGVWRPPSKELQYHTLWFSVNQNCLLQNVEFLAKPTEFYVYVYDVQTGDIVCHYDSYYGGHDTGPFITFSKTNPLIKNKKYLLVVTSTISHAAFLVKLKDKVQHGAFICSFEHNHPDDYQVVSRLSFLV